MKKATRKIKPKRETLNGIQFSRNIDVSASWIIPMKLIIHELSDVYFISWANKLPFPFLPSQKKEREKNKIERKQNENRYNLKSFDKFDWMKCFGGFFLCFHTRSVTVTTEKKKIQSFLAKNTALNFIWRVLAILSTFCPFLLSHFQLFYFIPTCASLVSGLTSSIAFFFNFSLIFLFFVFSTFPVFACLFRIRFCCCCFLSFAMLLCLQFFVIMKMKNKHLVSVLVRRQVTTETRRRW